VQRTLHNLHYAKFTEFAAYKSIA